MKKIGMIVAMTKELKEYFTRLGKVIDLSDDIYEAWSAEAYGKQLFIIKSGVGEISAAAATQYLITKYGVDIIINFGICGKLSSSLKLLDTVAVKNVVFVIEPFHSGIRIVGLSGYTRVVYLIEIASFNSHSVTRAPIFNTVSIAGSVITPRTLISKLNSAADNDNVYLQ